MAVPAAEYLMEAGADDECPLFLYRSALASAVRVTKNDGELEVPEGSLVLPVANCSLGFVMWTKSQAFAFPVTGAAGTAAAAASAATKAIPKPPRSTHRSPSKASPAPVSAPAGSALKRSPSSPVEDLFRRQRQRATVAPNVKSAPQSPSPSPSPSLPQLPQPSPAASSPAASTTRVVAPASASPPAVSPVAATATSAAAPANKRASKHQKRGRAAASSQDAPVVIPDDDDDDDDDDAVVVIEEPPASGNRGGSQLSAGEVCDLSVDTTRTLSSPDPSPAAAPRTRTKRRAGAKRKAGAGAGAGSAAATAAAAAAGATAPANISNAKAATPSVIVVDTPVASPPAAVPGAVDLSASPVVGSHRTPPLAAPPSAPSASPPPSPARTQPKQPSAAPATPPHHPAVAAPCCDCDAPKLVDGAAMAPRLPAAVETTAQALLGRLRSFVGCSSRDVSVVEPRGRGRRNRRGGRGSSNLWSEAAGALSQDASHIGTVELDSTAALMTAQLHSLVDYTVGFRCMPSSQLLACAMDTMCLHPVSMRAADAVRKLLHAVHTTFPYHRVCNGFPLKTWAALSSAVARAREVALHPLHCSCMAPSRVEVDGSDVDADGDAADKGACKPPGDDDVGRLAFPPAPGGPSAPPPPYVGVTVAAALACVWVSKAGPDRVAAEKASVKRVVLQQKQQRQQQQQQQQQHQHAADAEVAADAPRLEPAPLAVNNLPNTTDSARWGVSPEAWYCLLARCTGPSTRLEWVARVLADDVRHFNRLAHSPQPCEACGHAILPNDVQGWMQQTRLYALLEAHPSSVAAAVKDIAHACACLVVQNFGAAHAISAESGPDLHHLHGESVHRWQAAAPIRQLHVDSCTRAAAAAGTLLWSIGEVAITAAGAPILEAVSPVVDVFCDAPVTHRLQLCKAALPDGALARAVQAQLAERR